MGYIGKELTKGAFKLITLGASFNGSTTAFTMSEAAGNANNLLVILGGVLQHWGEAYTVSGTTITFSSAPASSTTIKILKLGDTYDMGQAGSLKPEAVSGLTNITTLADADEFLVHDATDNQLKAVVKTSMPGGAWATISNTTISSAVSEIEFDTSGAYKVFAIHMSGVRGASENQTKVLMKRSSYDTSGYFQVARWEGTASGTTYSGNSTASGSHILTGNTFPSSASKALSGSIYIYNPSNTDAYTYINGWASGEDNSNFYASHFSGRNNDTGAVTAVKYLFTSGNIAAGNFVFAGLT